MFGEVGLVCPMVLRHTLAVVLAGMWFCLTVCTCALPFTSEGILVCVCMYGTTEHPGGNMVMNKVISFVDD